MVTSRSAARRFVSGSSACLTFGLLWAVFCVPAGAAWAQADIQLQELSRLLDSGRVAEAPVFAPATWEKAQQASQRARSLADKNSDAGELSKQVEAALRQANAALSTSIAAKQELASFLETRSRAREARAQFVTPAEYMRAEEELMRATRRLESGDAEGGVAQARKAEPLFDAAELAALHKAQLQVCDSLIMVALETHVDRYAPATLALAKSHRSRAYELIIADRQDRSVAASEADQAAYEARHAMQLARSIRELDESRSSWEDVLLDFERETERVGQSLGLKRLGFDRGATVATDSVISQAQSLRADLEAAGLELKDVSTVLGDALAETGESSPSTHPVELATQTAERLTRLTEEKSDWARMAKARQDQLAEVSQLADETAYELEQRRLREEKFKAAQQALTVSEGVVLYNNENDIVLRLTGLSFDPGKTDLKSAHQKILTKVVGILEQFPENRIRVEGHTDARGSKSGNLALSEKRALAVRDHLISVLSLREDRIEARGYGDEQPVASNSSADGRAKNRRIDVVILQ